MRRRAKVRGDRHQGQNATRHGAADGERAVRARAVKYEYALVYRFLTGDCVTLNAKDEYCTIRHKPSSPRSHQYLGRPRAPLAGVLLPCTTVQMLLSFYFKVVIYTNQPTTFTSTVDRHHRVFLTVPAILLRVHLHARKVFICCAHVTRLMRAPRP